MKKILLLFFLTIVGLVFYRIFSAWFPKNTSQNIINKKEDMVKIIPTLSNIKTNTIELINNRKKITVSWIKITNLKKLHLLPNFSEKLSAESVKNINKCESIINGGFYYENNTPIGLFQINNDEISNEIASNFFNGFFFVSSDEKAGIRREIPTLNFNFALQSGPILIERNNPLDLKIINDEEDRRIVVAVNRESEIFFISLYKSDFEIKGPLLSDVPIFLKELEDKIGENFETALNLDGGTASAFYAPGISLREITSVGSFFCVKK